MVEQRKKRKSRRDDLTMSETETLQKNDTAVSKTLQYDPEKFTWQQASGSSGKYQRADKQESVDYQLLVKDLEVHRGRMTKGGLFYWLFRDGETVGRKPKAKREVRH